MRLLAIADALEGRSRKEAAELAGMDRQTRRDRVIRCNAAGLEGRRDRPRARGPAALPLGAAASGRR